MISLLIFVCEPPLLQYGDLQNSDDLASLHSELKKYMLRRMKEDVESSLKAKQETIVEVESMAVQKQYYRGIYQADTK